MPNDAGGCSFFVALLKKTKKTLALCCKFLNFAAQFGTNGRRYA